MMEYQSIKLLNRENVVRWQKAENQLFKKLERKKIYVQKPKRERILESSLMELPAAAKRLRKIRTDMCDLIW